MKVKITESKLRQIINESIKKVLRESEQGVITAMKMALSEKKK